MGDCFYKKDNVLTRLEYKNTPKAIPAFKAGDGTTIKMPRLSNMLLNLSKYSFSINDRKSCSQYLDGSDLNFGRLTLRGDGNDATRSISEPPFGNKLAQTEENFTGVSGNQWALNTKKGVWFIKRDNINVGLGIRLRERLLQNRGDSFTLSTTMAQNNGLAWANYLQIISDNASRNNNGFLRIEKADNKWLKLYYNGRSGPAGAIDLHAGDSNDRIFNVILRITRNNSDNLMCEAWCNGNKIGGNHNLGVMKGNPLELLTMNCGQATVVNGQMNLFIMALRVWNTALGDDEITMLNKIEARNLGRESFPSNPDIIYDYLRS